MIQISDMSNKFQALQRVKDLSSRNRHDTALLPDGDRKRVAQSTG